MKSIAKASALLSLAMGTFAHNVLDFGAIPDRTDAETEKSNALAILSALSRAHEDDTDREILIPEGVTISSMPLVFNNIDNVTFTIDGTLLASKNNLDYPLDGNNVFNFFDIKDVSFIKF